jgi:hypothetical protein
VAAPSEAQQTPLAVVVLPEDEGGTKVLEMPDCYRREMLADWRGAGLAQGTPDTLRWYTVNRHKMMLGPETRAWIEGQLGFVESAVVRIA